MKNIIKLILLCFIIAFGFSLAHGDDREVIRRYSKDHELKGYTIREGDRETHYDRSWRREGFSLYERGRRENFDQRGNRIGYDEYLDDRKHEWERED